MKMSFFSANTLMRQLARSVPRCKNISRINTNGHSSLLSSSGVKSCNVSNRLFSHVCVRHPRSPVASVHAISVRHNSTEVDKALGDAAEEEMQYTRDQGGDDLPQLDGYTATHDGSVVTLTKKGEGETINIYFNVNDTLEQVNFDTESMETDEEPELVCRPSFIVEINKGGQDSIQLECDFLDDEDIGAEESEGRHLVISSVSMNVGHDQKDSVYYVKSDNMDENMYEKMREVLEARGIDSEFRDKFQDYATAYERQLYLKFLDGLKNCMKK